MSYSRRDVLKLGLGAGAALALSQDLTAWAPSSIQSVDTTRGSQLLKTIPSSGEKIPAVGLGTASSFSQAAGTPEEHAELKEVLRLFTDLGGSVIDTDLPTAGERRRLPLGS